MSRNRGSSGRVLARGLVPYASLFGLLIICHEQLVVAPNRSGVSLFRLLLWSIAPPALHTSGLGAIDDAANFLCLVRSSILRLDATSLLALHLPTSPAEHHTWSSSAILLARR
jgi:hypothetical protein